MIPAAAGLAAGPLMLWIFRRLADREAMRRALGRIQAHLLEFWLFVDEPSVVWRSWRGLLGANGRFLWALLPSLLVLSAATAPVLYWLDACYGTAPLPVGRPAVVTVELERLSPAVLQVPDGVLLESPPVRSFVEREVSWRIRPLRAVSGKLNCQVDGATVSADLEAGTGNRCISARHRLSGPVRAIEVTYPPAKVSLFGAEAHWSVWFLASSLVGALFWSKTR